MTTPATGRTAVVTGGARGIGLEVCRQLAGDGVRVVVTDLDDAACRHASMALPGAGHAGVRMDVADETSVIGGFAYAESVFGRHVDILVACAGIPFFAPGGDRPLVVDSTLADWDRTLGVNLKGCFLTCREYARRSPPQNPQGRVITIASSAAQLGGYRSSAVYVASKAGVLGFTKALARELAPRGITVNSVAPGMIDTPLLRECMAPEDDAKAAGIVPMNRLGLPQDVAGAVRYLASPEAAYLTGVTIDVNGGLRMQ